jgi:carboxyl-terminal processing protease
MKIFHNNLMRTIALIVFPALFIMASCEEDLIGIEKVNTPVNNFEHFWHTFDQHYGLFQVKEIDWNALYGEFRSHVNDQMTDAELYAVLSNLIVRLNDNHVNLYPTNGELPVFPGGVLRYQNGDLTILKAQEDYTLNVVKNYVTNLRELSPNLRYGLLDNNIGYVNFSGTDSRKSTEKNMEKVLNDLRETRALVIDVRGHYGGFDAVAQYVAGRFTTETILYMTSRKRNGPNHTDFTDTTKWYAVPTGNYQYTKPIILLTSRFTQSAGETFALAMKTMDHVTLLGDTTAGSFSDNPNFEMPNGWIFSVSVGDYRAADGKSYEGFGMAPDVWIRNTKEDLLANKDRTLERAVELLLQ